MPNECPIVHIVDDDPQMCESLSLIVRSVGLQAEAYLSAEAFLDGICDQPNTPECLVLDVRMPGMSGLGLQQMLASQGKKMPIIMISGCADTPMVVKAMVAGAVDFLEKPFSRYAMLACIRQALDRSAESLRLAAHAQDLAARTEKLSTRQREVCDLLIAGKHSKQIAGALGIDEKTVAKHRAGVLEKMQVENVVELVRLMSEANSLSPVSILPTMETSVAAGTRIRC